MQSSSSSPDGKRKLWANIWGANIPPKVKIFVWKLCKDILPTEHNKLKRRLKVEDTCDLCGMEPETSYRAVISCRCAADLRQATCAHWNLPDEDWFAYTGPNWLLILLDGCTAEQKVITLLLFWRSWIVHNYITHDFGPSGLTESIHALLSFKSKYGRMPPSCW
jgi:hypothetical protein